MSRQPPRRLRAACLGLALLAASASATAGPNPTTDDARSPEALSAFMVDGRFEPGSFEWLRWKFSDDPHEQAKWKQVMQWVGTKAELRKKEVTASLTALGYPRAKVPAQCLEDDTCRWVMLAGWLTSLPSWEAAKKAIDEARPFAQGYVMAVTAMERHAREDTSSSSLSKELLSRIRVEQTLRAAATDPEATPGISAEGKLAWRMFIWREIMRRDTENTQWLKEMVARNGWPRRSVVGADAAHAAWLIAQHADRDPAFQLAALQRMEPLVARSEVTPKDYAFLYDRVFGELRGRQLYGTQMICAGGRYEPQPIEDAAGVDRRRVSVGLPELGVQLAKYTHRTC